MDIIYFVTFLQSHWGLGVQPVNFGGIQFNPEQYSVSFVFPRGGL